RQVRDQLPVGRQQVQVVDVGRLEPGVLLDQVTEGGHASSVEPGAPVGGGERLAERAPGPPADRRARPAAAAHLRLTVGADGRTGTGGTAAPPSGRRPGAAAHADALRSAPAGSAPARSSRIASSLTPGTGDQSSSGTRVNPRRAYSRWAARATSRVLMTTARQPRSAARSRQARTRASPTPRRWAAGSTASIRSSPSPGRASSAYRDPGSTNRTAPTSAPVLWSSATSRSPAFARAATSRSVRSYGCPGVSWPSAT